MSTASRDRSPELVGPREEPHRRIEVNADDIRRVIADANQPGLVFQPIVDLKRGVVAGYEALARFSGEPATTPDVWFQVADALGYGPELEARVIQRALAVRPELPASCFLAINVSPHLLASPQVRNAFDAGGDLAGVIVELTEHVPVHDHLALDRSLTALRARRAQIALDDAGSGYAGLQQLLCVRPALIKLDHTLVHEMDKEPVKRALTELLGNVAGQMDSWLLAEGIERDEELITAIDLGVPLGQGWLLGRPAKNWPQIHPDMATRIRLLAHRSTSDDRVLGLVHRSGTTRGTPEPQIAESSAHWQVVVDSEDCPVGLLYNGEPRPITLRVSPMADVGAVALRALARRESERFDPLVAVDESGRHIGLVLMERLVAHLAKLKVGTG